MFFKKKIKNALRFGFFGRPKIIFLKSKMPEGNYNYQELTALKNGVHLNKLTWLVKANIGVFYIEFIRKFSYFPRFQRLFLKIENQIFNFNHPKPFVSKLHNPIVKERVFSKDVIESLRLKVLECGRFKSPYAPNRIFDLNSKDQFTSLWNFEEDFLHLNEFIKIACEKTLVNHCQKILGSNCSISWVWLWHTFYGEKVVANQLWHRDSSEPFTFTRVFIPLTNVLDQKDGPTEFFLPKDIELPNSTFEPRRIHDEEIETFSGSFERKKIFAKVGSFYTANTFWCLHRGTSVIRKSPRSMLSLLISNAPSHRTVSIPKVSINEFKNPYDQELILQNRRWLKNIVSF